MVEMGGDHAGSAFRRALDAALQAAEDGGRLVVTADRGEVLDALCGHLERAGVVSPTLALPLPTARSALAGFLEGVADGRSDVGDWYFYAATRYPDPLMEAVRSEAVALVHALPVGGVLSPEAGEHLRALARRLRDAGS